MKPQFFILAGPNGAGKSTFGHHHIKPGLSIFNGDLVFAEIQAKYPQLSAEQVAGGVAVALERERDQALADKTDFAFESNFSNNMAAFISSLFKEAGFETTLIYFGLNHPDESVSRVMHRIENGGHDVSLDVIRYNFEEGLKRVNANFHLFDHIRFVDTGVPPTSPVIAYLNKEQSVLKILNEQVTWFNAHFRENLQNHCLEMTKEQNNDQEQLPSGSKRGR